MKITTRELKTRELNGLKYEITDIKRLWQECESSDMWLGGNSCEGNCSNCNYCLVTIKEL